MNDLTTTACRTLSAVVLTLSLGSMAYADEPPTLEADLGSKVDLNLPETTVGQALDAIGTVASLEFIYDTKVDVGARTSAVLSDVSLDEALRHFLRANRLFYVVRGPDTLLIAPDTRQKRQEYTPRAVRTFRLEHAPGRTVVTVLRSLLQSRNLVLDDRLNTITMNDTLAQLDLAAEVIERVDRDKDAVSEIGAADEEPLWAGCGYDPDCRSSGRPVPRLAVDMERRLTIAADPEPARKLYEILGRATGIEFLFDREVDLDRPITFGVDDRPAREALDGLNDRLSCISVVWGPHTVFVAPDEHGRREAEELVGIQFFYLSQADRKGVITSLRSILQTRQVVEIPHLNAVAVRDDLAALEAAADLVRGMDVAR